jgi:hypothetical protein
MPLESRQETLPRSPRGHRDQTSLQRATSLRHDTKLQTVRDYLAPRASGHNSCKSFRFPEALFSTNVSPTGRPDGLSSGRSSPGAPARDWVRPDPISRCTPQRDGSLIERSAFLRQLHGPGRERFSHENTRLWVLSNMIIPPGLLRGVPVRHASLPVRASRPPTAISPSKICARAIWSSPLRAR